MNWALIVVGAVALLFALVFAMGSSMSVSHVVVVQRKFKIRADDLWAILTDYNRSTDWRSGLKALTEDSLNHWSEINRYGDKVRYRMEVVNEKRTLVTRILSKDLPYGGYWEFSLVPGEGDCYLKITEYGEVYNSLFRFLSKYVFGHEATLNAYLNDLGTRVKNSPSTAL